MKKILLAIENDLTFERAYCTKGFIRKYEGEVIEMTGFKAKSQAEIVKNVSKCTDIAVQTLFIGGSDTQLEDMVGLLSQITRTINVYIAYGNDQSELYEYFVKYLTPAQLLSIKQHNVFSMGCNIYDSLPFEPHIKLDFTSVTKKLSDRKVYIQNYKDTASSRPTGRKVMVLGCNAFGSAFTNLPIGQVVDELECSELLETKKPARGVWIMGNGEPIMLVNDNGDNEYKLVTKLSPNEILLESAKASYFNLKKLKQMEIDALVKLIESENDSMSKANDICEIFGVEKRGNRQKICILLNENLVA